MCRSVAPLGYPPDPAVGVTNDFYRPRRYGWSGTSWAYGDSADVGQGEVAKLCLPIVLVVAVALGVFLSAAGWSSLLLEVIYFACIAKCASFPLP